MNAQSSSSAAKSQWLDNSSSHWAKSRIKAYFIVYQHEQVAIRIMENELLIQGVTDQADFKKVFREEYDIEQF